MMNTFIYRFKNLILNLLLICFSVVFTFILIEMGLRLFYPKYKYAAEASFKKDADRIWSRKANDSYIMKHPDTKKPHTVHYNNLALRQDRDFNEEDLLKSINIGFFGDSFTENIRMPAQYSFTEPLDYLLNTNNQENKFNILNFGIGGYGTGQSYLYYRDFKYSKKFRDVFYVFCSNDLRNIYENHLFTLNKDGKLIQHQIQNHKWWIDIISKLHSTYFLMDLMEHFKIQMKNSKYFSFFDKAHEKQKIESRQLQQEQKKRFHDKNAMKIEESINRGDDSKDLNNSIGIFQAILKKWDQTVRNNGANFHIVILPRESDHHIYPFIPKDIDVIDLFTLFEHKINNYDYNHQWRFVYNGHWNEKANYMASYFLYKTLQKELDLRIITEEELTKSLCIYYQSFNGYIPNNLCKKNIKIDVDTIKSIVNKYTNE